MAGGGSCEMFALDRGDARWVLRRAPRHASSATAHDVLREFRILDAIKDEPVRIARPVLSLRRRSDVFGAPFYVMARIDGVPVRGAIPAAVGAAPRRTQRARGTHRRAGGDPRRRLGGVRSGRPGARGDYLGRQIAAMARRSSTPTRAGSSRRRRDRHLA